MMDKSRALCMSLYRPSLCVAGNCPLVSSGGGGGGGVCL